MKPSGACGALKGRACTRPCQPARAARGPMAELAALQEKVRLCAPCAWHQHALTRSRNVQLDAERAKNLELTAELNRLRKEKGADPVRCRAGRRPLARSHPLHALSQGATASRRSSWPAAPERTRTRSISRWWTRSWRAVRPALWISRRCSLILRTLHSASCSRRSESREERGRNCCACPKNVLRALLPAVPRAFSLATWLRLPRVVSDSDPRAV